MARPPDAGEGFEALFGDEMMASQIEMARQSRALIAAMSPEGTCLDETPPDGWEQLVWGGLGLDDR